MKFSSAQGRCFSLKRGSTRYVKLAIFPKDPIQLLQSINIISDSNTSQHLTSDGALIAKRKKHRPACSD
jgi:hypothetical protein